MANNPKMYELLVQDPDDVLAALAYTAYKQHETEYIQGIKISTGVDPTEYQMDSFFHAASAPAQLAMYQSRAEALALAFIEATVDSRMRDIEINFDKTLVGRQLERIVDKQGEPRTWKGWLADSVGNLGVNFLSILLIALVLFGYKAIDRWSGDLGRSTGVLQQEAPSTPPAAVTSERNSDHAK